MKKRPGGTNSRLSPEEEKIHVLQDSNRNYTKETREREAYKKYSIMNHCLWDNIKQSKLYVFGIPEKEEKRREKYSNSCSHFSSLEGA